MNSSHLNSRNNHRPKPVDDFDHIGQPEAMVEHLTVAGFLRRNPRAWHLDEIKRFGDQVGKIAEALHLAYVTTCDRSLGAVRIFPLPLLQRVYEILAPQYGWPLVMDIEPPSLGDERKAKHETLRSHERLAKHMRALLPVVANMEVQHSAATVLQWLDVEVRRLREELGADEGNEGR